MEVGKHETGAPRGERGKKGETGFPKRAFVSKTINLVGVKRNAWGYKTGGGGRVREDKRG